MIKFCVPLLVYLFIYFLLGLEKALIMSHCLSCSYTVHRGHFDFWHFDNTDEMGDREVCVHLEILATLVAPNYGHTWELYVEWLFTLLLFL